jgi:hypothetical protein
MRSSAASDVYKRQGYYRELTEEEVEELKKSVKMKD